MYWLKLSDKKQKKMGDKLYFATEYTRNVLDKNAGDPCAYVEDADSVGEFNNSLPFSANETCFIGKGCSVSDGCVLKNAAISGNSIIKGDIDIFNSTLINVEIYAGKKNKDISRRINNSTIFAEKNMSAKIKIEGPESALIVSDSHVSLTSKLSRKQNALLLCVDLGGFLTISDSDIKLSKYGISVHKNNLEISNTNMYEGSGIDVFAGDRCSIARSELYGEVFGHGLYIADSTIEGKILVESHARSFSSISSNILGNSKICLSGGWLCIENTDVSDFATIKLKDSCDDIVVITDCKVKGFATMEYYKVKPVPRECNNTVFSESCIVRDARCFNSNISGNAYVYGVTVDKCWISGNARIGADVESVDIPYDISSKTVVKGHEISGILDFYSIKIHDNKYATFDSRSSYISDEHGLLSGEDVSSFYLKKVDDVKQIESFVFNNILNFSYGTFFEDSVKESMRFIIAHNKNYNKIKEFVSSLVYCSIIKLLISFSVDNPDDIGLNPAMLDEFNSYVSKYLKFDISSTHFVNYDKNIIVFPKLIENIPNTISSWFDKADTHNGFTI